MRQRKRVFRSRSVLYIRFRDADGKLVRKATNTDDPRKAEELAIELEAKALRSAAGSNPPPEGRRRNTLVPGREVAVGPEGQTLIRAAPRISLRKQSLPRAQSQIACWRTLRPGQISEWLAGIERTEQTKKHLRGYLNRAFELAAERSGGPGPIPSPLSRCRRSRSPAWATTCAWRRSRRCLPLSPPRTARCSLRASTTGLRKGELCALQKRDVDLVNRHPGRGPELEPRHDQGGTSMVIPIHIRGGALVQAGDQGQHLRTWCSAGGLGRCAAGTRKLADLLRRALVRAGIVDPLPPPLSEAWVQPPGCRLRTQRRGAARSTV
jgi:hypothetical protein